MLTLVIVEGIVILLLTLLVAGLLRSHAEILRKLDALGAGEEVAPGAVSHSLTLGPTRRADSTPAAGTITGTTPAGGSTAISLEGTRGFTLLAFMSSGCSTCRPFWRAFDREMDLPRNDIRPVIVTKGPAEESPSEIARMAPSTVTTLMSSEAWDAFRVPGTPYFQLIDTERGLVVGEGSAGSWPRLVELLRRALGDAGYPDDAHRLGRTTKERLQDSDEELRRAGIEPGDPSLYHGGDG
jgi:hypothetical protein